MTQRDPLSYLPLQDCFEANIAELQSQLDVLNAPAVKILEARRAEWAARHPYVLYDAWEYKQDKKRDQIQQWQSDHPDIPFNSRFVPTIEDDPYIETVPVHLQAFSKATKNYRMAEQLEKEGIHKVKWLAASGSSVLFELPNDQILRVSRTNTGSNINKARPRVRWITSLQPIRSFPAGDLEYEVMVRDPFLCPKDTGAYERLRENVAASGYSVFEKDFALEKGDILGLSDGTAIAVDKEAIELPHPHFTPVFDPARDAEWVVESPNSKKESIFPQLQGTGYLSKQEKDFPAINDGRIRGVLNETDRARLEDRQLFTLTHEKPECFIMLIKDKASMAPAERALADTEQGLQQLYRIHKNDRSDYFFQVTQEMLPAYCEKVFTQKLYPIEAMQQLHQERAVEAPIRQQSFAR